MDILETPVGIDVKKVLDAAPPMETSINIRATIIVGTVHIKPARIHQHVVRRDYAGSTGDDRTLVVTVSKEEYAEVIYPNRLDLKCELTIANTNVQTKIAENKASGKHQRYIAKLIKPVDLHLTEGTSNGNTLTKLREGEARIALELTDVSYDDLAFMSVSTVLQGNSVEAAIEMCCSGMGDFPIVLHPIDNTRSVKNIVLEDGTKTLMVANWLQRYGGGVYFNGISTYVQNGTVYVFPISLLDKHPFRKSINIFHTGSTAMMGVDTTSCTINDTLNIISTGKMEFLDNVEFKEHAIGNATRWNQSCYLSDIVAHKDGATTVKRIGYNNHAIADRVHTNTTIGKLSTTNACFEVSRINDTQGRYLTVPWDNAKDGLIVPNMEVYFNYMTVKGPVRLHGIIVSCVFDSKEMPDAGQIPNFKTVAMLTLRIK